MLIRDESRDFSFIAYVSRSGTTWHSSLRHRPDMARLSAAGDLNRYRFRRAEKASRPAYIVNVKWKRNHVS